MKAVVRLSLTESAAELQRGYVFLAGSVFAQMKRSPGIKGLMH